MKTPRPIQSRCADPDGFHAVLLNFDEHGWLCLGRVPAAVTLLVGGWLTAGRGEFDPGFGNCELELDFGNDCLISHLFHGEALLATAGLAWSPRTSTKLWDFLLGQQEAAGQPMRPWRPKTLPWLAVTLAPELLDQRDTATINRVYRSHWVVSWLQLQRLGFL